jgi:hypothetical protein
MQGSYRQEGVMLVALTPDNEALSPDCSGVERWSLVAKHTQCSTFPNHKRNL